MYGDVSSETNGARQHKAVIVVGVFPNEIDAAGCTRDRRMRAESLFKTQRQFDGSHFGLFPSSGSKGFPAIC
jgi:hypothetical protein